MSGSHPKGYMSKYTREAWQQLLDRYGRKCSRCLGSKCHNYDLQFAHIRPTKLTGMGRGKLRRLNDIRKNPDCYLLMGKKCHMEFDAQ